MPLPTPTNPVFNGSSTQDIADGAVRMVTTVQGSPLSWLTVTPDIAGAHQVRINTVAGAFLGLLATGLNAFEIDLRHLHDTNPVEAGLMYELWITSAVDATTFAVEGHR